MAGSSVSLHTMIISDDGRVCGFGKGAEGQFGSLTTDVISPTMITIFNEKVEDIAIGAYHCFALTETGSVLGWGDNAYGQLGALRSQSKFTEPRLIELPILISSASSSSISSSSSTSDSTSSSSSLDNDTFSSSIIGLAASQYSSMLLTDSGSVYSFGYSGSGHLGHGPSCRDTHVPKKIQSLENVMVIGCGSVHSLALTSDGKVYSWGYGSYGQLGHGTTESLSSPEEITFFTKLKATSGVEIVALSGGEGHSMALTLSGEVYSWGREGRLGYPLSPKNTNTKTSSTTPYTTSTTSTTSTSSTSSTNTSGGSGFISNSAFSECQTTPKKIKGLTNIIAIASGGRHNLALTEKGTVFVWGLNDYCQVGHPRKDQCFIIPHEIPGLKNVVRICCGSRHSLVMLADGSIISWGAVDHGQCGHRSGLEIAYPAKVTGIPLDFNPIKFAGNYMMTTRGTARYKLHVNWYKHRLLWIGKSDPKSAFTDLPTELLILIQDTILKLTDKGKKEHNTSSQNQQSEVGDTRNEIAVEPEDDIKATYTRWKEILGFWNEKELDSLMASPLSVSGPNTNITNDNSSSAFVLQKPKQGS